MTVQQVCNGDWLASHYELWRYALINQYYWFERPTLLMTFLLGWVIAREVIPAVIRVQRKAAVGQNIYESGPAAHLAKQGTPTMGGLAFPLAAAVAAIILAVATGRQELLFIALLVVAVAAIGFVDDFLKIKRGSALGLRARAKMVLLTIVAAFAAFAFLHTQPLFCPMMVFVTGSGQWWFGHHLALSDVWFYALAIIAIVGCANAVNLTDGVDGLAASVALPPLIVFSWFDGGGIALAVTAAVVVFLFYNKHPAKVFMGDTGSLTLGALLAFLAIKEHLLLFLPLLGIVFVVEALSVIAQVISFKITGKRIFKMSPLHHHFELSGWSEQRITRTFALVSWLATVIFIAIVYYSDVRVPGT